MLYGKLTMQRQEMYAKMCVGNFACKILPLAQTFEVYVS